MSLNVLVVALAVAQGNVAERNAGLTEQQSRDLRTACTAFEKGSPLEVVQHLAPLATQQPLLPAVEDVLQRRELPPAGKVLALSRLEMVRQGRTSQLPRAERGETLLLLPAIKDYLQESLQEIASRPVMRDVMPLSETLNDFRQAFRQLDVVQSKLADIERAATYLRKLARGVPPADLETLDDEVRRMVANDDVGELLDALELIREGLTERRVELAIERLKVSLSILADPQITPLHLLASGTVQSDGQLAVTFLKSRRGKPPLRRALRERGLLKQVTADAETARQKAGPLAVKAKLLHDGLQWWLRGRYGAGPEVMGLVKSEQAMRTPEGRFHIFMPNETPKPEDPLARDRGENHYKETHPQYRRRHLYTWAWTNRFIYEQGWSYDNTIYSDVETRTATRKYWCSKTHTYIVTEPVSYTKTRDRGQYFSREIVENDNTNLLRLVGYLEYAMALAHFEQLVKTASLAELAAMDELVKSHDEYAIYVNLSRNFPQAATSRFAELPQQENDTYRRHGLAWVIALARIEVGAMLAAYSTRNDAFASVRPSQYEADAFEELLLDSMRLHVWGLQSDPLSDRRKLRQAALRNPQIGLVYERRVKLVLKLIDAVRKLAGQRATQPQLAELKQYEDRFGELYVSIRREILRLGRDAARQTDVSKFNRGKDDVLRKVGE